MIVVANGYIVLTLLRVKTHSIAFRFLLNKHVSDVVACSAVLRIKQGKQSAEGIQLPGSFTRKQCLRFCCSVKMCRAVDHDISRGACYLVETRVTRLVSSRTTDHFKRVRSTKGSCRIAAVVGNMHQLFMLCAMQLSVYTAAFHCSHIICVSSRSLASRIHYLLTVDFTIGKWGHVGVVNSYSR